MPIIAETTKTSENHWYDDHESIAKCWEELGKKLDGKSTGVYNHYLVNFEIEIPTNNGEILFIKGEKKFNNVKAGIFSKPSPYSQVLEFKIEHSSNSREFVLKKISFFNTIISSFKSYNNSRKIGDYKLRYNTNSILQNLSKTELSKIEKLNEITFSNDKLYLKTLDLTNDLKTAKWSVDFFLRLIKASVVI